MSWFNLITSKKEFRLFVQKLFLINYSFDYRNTGSVACFNLLPCKLED